MRKKSNSKGSPGEDSMREEIHSATDRELLRLRESYFQAEAKLYALEQKVAGEVAKYGEEHLLKDRDWHKTHYEASEAVRSAKYWLDAYISEMHTDTKTS